MNVSGRESAEGSAGVKPPRLQVRDNAVAECFEIYVDQHLAGYLRYRIRDGEIWLIETTVSREHCIDNLVPHLAGSALETARQCRLDVRPISPAVRSFIAIHPEYGAGAADGSRPPLTAAREREAAPEGCG